MRVGSPPIHFVYHFGLHCTDDDMLVRSLRRNGAALAAKGVLVPRPRRYRVPLGEFASAHRGAVPEDAAQAAFLTDTLGGGEAERIVLSHPNLVSMPAKIFDGQKLYGKIGQRAHWLRNLYPDNPCEFCLAIRNPATFIPAAMRLANVPDYERFLGGLPLDRVRWPEVVRTLAAANPGCPITVWCNEDTPMIWPALLREIADIGPLDPMGGELDLLQTIMRPEGFRRMQEYLAQTPPQTEIQRRRVIAAFLDKYALDEAIEEEVDLPDWTPAVIEEITQRYEEDLYVIARMPGVNLISV